MRVHSVESAEDMFNEVQATIEGADIFIGVAAVADYRPKVSSNHKIKKEGDDGLTLEMVQNPDILKFVAGRKGKPFTVGFAAETGSLIEHAKQKLQKKKLDMIIANNVADPNIGFNSDNNQTIVLTATAKHEIPMMSKTELCEAINRPDSQRDRMKNDGQTRSKFLIRKSTTILRYRLTRPVARLEWICERVSKNPSSSRQNRQSLFQQAWLFISKILATRPSYCHDPDWDIGMA